MGNKKENIKRTLAGEAREKVASSESRGQEIKELAIALSEMPELAELSEDALKKIAAVCHIKESYFSGPLPHPETLEHYEKICPGASDRIIRMAENNAEHRLASNTKIIDSDIRRSDRGQILGFALSVLFIVAAVICALTNSYIPASLLSIGGFSSIISIFVLGKKK